MDFIEKNIIWILTTLVTAAFAAGGFAMAQRRKATSDDVQSSLANHAKNCPLQSDVLELNLKIQEVKLDLRRETADLYYPKVKGEVLEAKLEYMSASIGRIEHVVMAIYEKYK